MGNSILLQKRKAKRFNLIRSLHEIEELTQTLPEDEYFKFLSAGGFSSISFIKFIADRAKINFMFASTLRIGRKHLWVLDELHRVGKLGICEFVVGSIMQNVCKINGWGLKVSNNHSKVLLFDTSAGKFVIETSSNLNENPKSEQFSFEKDAKLYEFYLNAFRGDDFGQ